MLKQIDILGGLSVLMVLSVLVAVFVAPQPDGALSGDRGSELKESLRVRRLEVIGESGEVLCDIAEHAEGGGVLRMYNANGDESVVVRGDGVDGGMIAVFGRGTELNLGIGGAMPGLHVVRHQKSIVSLGEFAGRGALFVSGTKEDDLPYRGSSILFPGSLHLHDREGRDRISAWADYMGAQKLSVAKDPQSQSIFLYWPPEGPPELSWQAGFDDIEQLWKGSAK